MKVTKIALIGFLLLATSMLAQQQSADGPFGFRPGMTRDQIIKAVGASAIKVVAGVTADSDVLFLNTAPKPHKAFESYMLMISPSHGLVKLLAVGVDTYSSDSGSELQSAFENVLAGVSQKYGPPKKTYDFCQTDTVGCSSSSMWMFGLLQKNRTLATYWEFDPSGSLQNIAVDAAATGMNAGHIDVAYEFTGFTEFIRARKAKQNESY